MMQGILTIRRFGIIVSFITFLMSFVIAQDRPGFPTSGWIWNASVGITTSHVSISNWAAGGAYAYSLGLESTMNPKWSDSLWSFVGTWEGSFSVFKSKSLPFQKTSDQLSLSLKAGRLVAKNIHVVAFSDLKTQFWPGYSDMDGSTDYVSNFFAPGYVTNGMGLDYRLDDIGLSAVFSPLTAKETFVLDRGVDKLQYNIKPDKRSLVGAGAYCRITYGSEILTKTTLASEMLIFAELTRNTNVDFYFKTRIEYAITTFLKLYGNLEMLNDDDSRVALFEDLDGDGFSDDFSGCGTRFQFKTEFGLMLSVSF